MNVRTCEQSSMKVVSWGPMGRRGAHTPKWAVHARPAVRKATARGRCQCSGTYGCNGSTTSCTHGSAPCSLCRALHAESSPSALVSADCPARPWNPVWNNASLVSRAATHHVARLVNGASCLAGRQEATPYLPNLRDSVWARCTGGLQCLECVDWAHINMFRGFV